MAGQVALLLLVFAGAAIAASVIYAVLMVLSTALVVVQP